MSFPDPHDSAMYRHDIMRERYNIRLQDLVYAVRRYPGETRYPQGSIVRSTNNTV